MSALNEYPPPVSRSGLMYVTVPTHAVAAPQVSAILPSLLLYFVIIPGDASLIRSALDEAMMMLPEPTFSLEDVENAQAAAAAGRARWHARRELQTTGRCCHHTTQRLG